MNEPILVIYSFKTERLSKSGKNINYYHFIYESNRIKVFLLKIPQQCQPSDK